MFLWMWAKSVSFHEETDLSQHELRDCARFAMEEVVAHVQTNLKTPGQVKPRAIHSATQNSLVPRGENDVALKLRRV